MQQLYCLLLNSHRTCVSTFKTLFKAEITAWCYCDLGVISDDGSCFWFLRCGIWSLQKTDLPVTYSLIFCRFFEKAVMEAGKSPTEANLIQATSGRKSIHPCVWNMTEKKELKRKEMRTKREVKYTLVLSLIIRSVWEVWWSAVVHCMRRAQVIININNYTLYVYNTFHTYMYNPAYILE